MNSLAYAQRAFLRAGSRNLAYVVGLALAAALSSGTLFFVDGSAREMTQRAIAPVLLDFQVRATDPTSTDVTAFAPQIERLPGIRVVRPFASAAVRVVPASPAGSAPLPARLLALPSDYAAFFPLLTTTSAELGPGTALVGEQLAHRLDLKPGDELVLQVPGMDPPYRMRVAGTVNTDAAEPLFVGPAALVEGSYNAASSVIVVDATLFARTLEPALRRAAQAELAAGALPPVAAASLPLLDRQLHVAIDRNLFPGDPAAADIAIAALRRTIERQAPGRLTVTDNLATALKNAARDVVSARLLFVFLGLPGILLAAYLARYAAALVAEAQRRDLALLRTRGIAPRQILAVVAWMILFTACVGTVLGLGLGALGTALLFGPGVLQDAGALLRAGAVALALGLVLAGVGGFLPVRAMLAAEVSEERRAVRASARPIWFRLPLDAALLAGAVLASWFSGTHGSRAALAGATETAAVSLGVYAFLGPLLFWIGSAILVRRVADWLLSRPTRGWNGVLSGLALRSLHHRSAQSAGGALLLVLALSFGVASSVFGATFEASRRADAGYLVGSDLRVTPPLSESQPTAFADQLKVPGVRSVTPVHVANDVLVGAQTQTVYAVDVPSLVAATRLQDAFFVDDTAAAVLDRLHRTPDGLLVSSELAVAYNVEKGDTIAMRIPTRSGSYAEVAPRIVGVFSIFPTSAVNSDLVVNSPLLVEASQNPNPRFFLVRTDGNPSENAAIVESLETRLRDKLAVRIDTADQAVSLDQSSLVGVNLAGLARLDRFYAALIVAVGLGVFLFGSVVERQRELGTLQALGATTGQVTRLLIAEALVLVVGGILGGTLIGSLLAWQYNGFLPGIFAVPLPSLSIPVAELAAMLGLALAGSLGAVLVGSLRLRRVWPAEVLRDL
jgi:putative ABC transport system permease protein